MTLERLEQLYAAARAGGGPDALQELAAACGATRANARAAAPLLLRILADPAVASVREDVVEALGAAGDPAAGPALLAALDVDEHWLRVKAIAALGRVRCRDAVASLREVLERGSRECWHTRSEAIEALVALGAREAAPELAAALLDGDEDPDVRIAAADALADLAVDDAAVPLRMTAAREQDEDVGAAARTALDRLPPRYAPAHELPARAYLPGDTSRPAERTIAGAPDERHRVAVDLYNRGFVWEAHEVWEDLWNESRARGETERAQLLQGLILCAAASVKDRLGDAAPARSLRERAAARLAEGAGASAALAIDVEALRAALADGEAPRAILLLG